VLFTLSTTIENYDEASISALSLADHTWKIVLKRAGLYRGTCRAVISCM